MKLTAKLEYLKLIVSYFVVVKLSDSSHTNDTINTSGQHSQLFNMVYLMAWESLFSGLQLVCSYSYDTVWG